MICLPVNLFKQWMRSLYGLVSWLFLHFSVCSIFNTATGAKMNGHAARNLGICKSFSNLFFRQVWQDINSVKKERETKKSTLKYLILRKMVMLLLLMADKCCLCVTWAERRWAICAPQLSRLQDWKQQDSKSNNYLYFLESAHTVGSCTALPDSRASALCMHYSHTASSCLPITAYHNNITN